MTYSTVPHLDKPISRIVVGSIAVSPQDLDRSFAMLDEYRRLGGNCIDTAHIYGAERHKAVGQYLKLHGRDSLILFNKGCHPMGGRKRVTRDDLVNDVLESNAHMGVDCAEFFVLHRDDPEVPAGEVVEWLNEQKDEGRISVFGGSNWHHARIEEANTYAAAHGLQGFSVSSPNLALGVVNEPMWADAYSVDREGRDWYEKTQFPLFSWSSGSGGFFAGYDHPDVHRVYDNEENFRRKARAQEIGDRYGATATQVAVAWVLHQPLNVWALIGPRTPAEVRESMAALDLKLTPAEVAYLETGSRID